MPQLTQQQNWPTWSVEQTMFHLHFELNHGPQLTGKGLIWFHSEQLDEREQDTVLSETEIYLSWFNIIKIGEIRKGFDIIHS